MTYGEGSDLLQGIIRIPSFSREEKEVADYLENYFSEKKISTQRFKNNLLAGVDTYRKEKPNVLLCSHFDTVKPNSGYTRDPFDGEIKDGKLHGLGSNDAGASLVCLILTYQKLKDLNLPYNLWLAAVAEEEISGQNGVASIISELPSMDLAIVGEPTSLKMAIAEKGLLVVDGYSTGIPGHAAHGNTLNPIYQAARDIVLLKDLTFERSSDLLGDTRITVSQINAGTQHNQVPAECHFVIDVRVNELYTNQEVFDILQTNTVSLLKARSFRLNSSGIDPEHPILSTASELKIQTYGSATLSDQALLPYPSIKIGPGDTKRSHTADEFIYLAEIEEGIKTYENILMNLNLEQ